MSANSRKPVSTHIKRCVYLAARTLGCFALCRRLTTNRIRILGYHGACDGDESRYNPFLFLSADTFRKRIDWLLKKGFHVIPLDQAVGMLHGAHNATRSAVVITFDDGWQSTARQLIPILAERHLPSTLYLSTSDFRNGWPIPIVTVNYMIWKSARERVEIHGLDEQMDGEYRLDEAAQRGTFLDRSEQWLTRHPATRNHVIARLHRLATFMSLDIDDLALETRRFDYVNRDEALALPASGCTVELHGHHHRYPRGDPQTFAADLQACRDTIVQLGLPTPHHYCYPSGRFDRNAKDVLEAHNVHSATTCTPGLIRRNGSAKRHYLPRFLDSEQIEMLDFEAELSGFAELLRRMLGR